MLFTYWMNPKLDEPPSAEAWRAQYPGFRIFGDHDVRSLLSPARLNLYDRITLPACKSDVARLVLLREYGGLYIDAHAGPAQGERLAETLDALASFELVLFCRAYLKKSPDETHLTNGAIAGRRHSLLLNRLIDCGFDHLTDQEAAESAASGYVHYNLWGIVGTWILLKCFFDLSLKPSDLKPEFKNMILVRHLATEEEPGFQLYKYYGYREPGRHWSERQKTEPLFRQASSPPTNDQSHNGTGRSAGCQCVANGGPDNPLVAETENASGGSVQAPTMTPVTYFSGWLGYP
jgi:hypothetical protein